MNESNSFLQYCVESPLIGIVIGTKQKINTRDNVRKEFPIVFRLLLDDNEIVMTIYSMKQGKEMMRDYNRRLLADELEKRWFEEGLKPSLRKKMKIIPPTSYVDTYDRAIDVESEDKTSKKKRGKSSRSEDLSEESNNDEDVYHTG